MKNTCTIIIILILSSVLFAQINKPTYDFLLVDEIPKFDYNGINFSEYINANLKLPKFFSGEDEVITSFVVDEKGSVCDVKVIRSHTEICKKAMIEVLSSMPKWSPGRYKGEYVRVRLYITIDFKLK